MRLHAWLALALALVIAAPALAGAGAWFAAGAWQAAQEADRRRDAADALRSAALDTAAGRRQAIARLAALDVEAEVMTGAGKLAMAKGAVLTTPGLAATLEAPDGKLRLEEYEQVTVPLSDGVAQMFVVGEPVAARWAIAIAAAAAVLAASFALVVVLLRRWVITPLARLADDADRIAGGELDMAPVSTRAREVAQVGEALHGMAGALRGALSAEAAAERDRRFLVTAIAHDLRTPLFTLRGSLEALERGIGDGRYLGLAQDRASHLDRLVSDLFRFSRLEYSPETAAREEVDIAALVRRAAEAVEPLAAASSCAVEVAPGQPAFVRGDPEALLRVLTNLLDNAIRHGSTRVSVSTSRANGSVTVAVADDGPGFAEEDLPHVFEPLFRGDRSRAGDHGGLGLAIARRLVRAHGGDVAAANDPSGGARLTVRLPG
jgi:signal transduction histidine kinase